MTKKTIFILLACVIAVICITGLTIHYFTSANSTEESPKLISAEDIHKSILKFDFPEGTKVLEQTNELFTIKGGNYSVKVAIPKEKIDSFTNLLISDEKLFELTKDELDYCNEESVIDWWDLDKKSVSKFYHKFTDRAVNDDTMSGELCIYIMNESNNNVNVYLRYTEHEF